MPVLGSDTQYQAASPFPLSSGYPPHPVSGSLSLCGLVLSPHSHPGGPQCSTSCSSGTRRRQVGCAIGPPGLCGSLQPSRPADVEPCNTQPCHLPPGKDRGGQLAPGPTSFPAINLASPSCRWAFACAVSPLERSHTSPCVKPLPPTKSGSGQPHQAALFPPSEVASLTPPP